MSDEPSNRRAETIEAVVAKLTPHLDIRCVPCGGTGVSIASGHDCRSCGGSGLSYSEMGEERANTLAREVISEVWSRFAVAQFKDWAEFRAVLDAAMVLCRDSLGDDALWAATTALREALTVWNGEPPHTDGEYWRTREANGQRTETGS